MEKWPKSPTKRNTVITVVLSHIYNSSIILPANLSEKALFQLAHFYLWMINPRIVIDGLYSAASWKQM